MKKQLILIAAIILAAFGFSSCSQECEMNIETAQDVTSSKYSAQEAAANVLEFIGNMNSTSSRAFKQGITVANVKPFSIGNKTRVTENTKTDTLFYIVNFNDSCGFAIAAADKEDTPVLALIDHGTYNEADSLNPGFEAFMDAMAENKIAKSVNLIAMPKDDINDFGGGGGSSSRPDKFEVMSPILKTKWSQGYPYNMYCPGPHTGCVVTAVSQICSFLEMPRHVKYQYNSEYGEASINWQKVNQECIQNQGAPLSFDTKEQIARLMRFFGVAFNAKYSNGGTDVNTGDALKTLRKAYGFNVTGLSDYNIDNVIKDLRNGHKIILMRGNGRYYHVGFVFRKYVDGHAWVVDGYIDQVKNNKENKYVHCNWGWGDSHNGYFLSNVLNAEQAPVYNDSIKSRSSSNFRYKLQTATFTK